jgi:hypothetical protein
MEPVKGKRPQSHQKKTGRLVEELRLLNAKFRHQFPSNSSASAMMVSHNLHAHEGAHRREDSLDGKEIAGGGRSTRM